ncbi:MAG: M48 family metalloprotease [Saprospiraceae bacterium]
MRHKEHTIPELIRTKGIIVILLFFSKLLPGQDLQGDYHPLRQYGPPYAVIQGYKARFSRWKERATFNNNQAKSAFTDLSQNSYKYISLLDTIGVLMYADSISKFVNTIKDQIVNSNPVLQSRNFKVFILRNNEPNASNLGEGIILFNLGLLERLKSVDQVAFVLSHEMGHDLLDHVFEGEIRYCDSFYDPDFRRTLHKTSKRHIGRNSELKQLMDSFMSGQLGMNRQNEISADSIGLLFFQKAGYDPLASIEVMNILDSSDLLIMHDSLLLSKTFNCEEYPFKPYWLDIETTLQSSAEKSAIYYLPDSLKSHPDCPLRAILLSKQFHSSEEIKQKEIPECISLTLHFESVEAQFQVKDYVMAMYLSLQLRKLYPDNIYLKCIISNCLVELSNAIQQGQFLDYVEFPDVSYAPAYNQLLIFLHNMTSTSLNKVNNCYFKMNLANVRENDYIGYLKIISNSTVVLTKQMVDDYNQKFDSPHFRTLLEKHLPNKSKRKE